MTCVRNSPKRKLICQGPRCRTRWCVCSVYNSQLQKSPSRISGQISGNSVDISKAFFGMVIWKFESSQVSQPVRRPEILPSEMLERRANGGLLRFSGRSPNAESGHFRREIADSLRRIFEIFPFSGDRDRRLGSIYTAWRAPQSYRGGCSAG